MQMYCTIRSNNSQALPPVVPLIQGNMVAPSSSFSPSSSPSSSSPFFSCEGEAEPGGVADAPVVAPAAEEEVEEEEEVAEEEEEEGLKGRKSVPRI